MQSPRAEEEKMEPRGSTENSLVGQAQDGHEQVAQILPLAPAGPALSHPFKRQALLQLLHEEIAKWESPGFYLPLLAFFVFCYDTKSKLKILVGGHLIDAFAFFLGDHDDANIPADADTCLLLACEIVREGADGEEGCSLRFPQSANHLLRVNHWVCGGEDQLLQQGQLEPHPPCGGCMCGGAGLPCMSPLFEACAANGIMPLPTVADGDCGADVCCFWSGVVQDRRHRTAMRGCLAHLMRQSADEDLWIRLFDTC
jgi:hypothetical protein